MSDNTSKFVAALAEDPESLERFKQDPKATMDEYGVPESHQKLILSGDKEKLAEEAGLDRNKVQFIII